MTASPASIAPPNETLDAAYELGLLTTGIKLDELGSIGDGPAGAADVEWYAFTLDQPAQIVGTLTCPSSDSSFEGVLSLFNNDPNDYGDPYDLNGHRLLDQVDQPANGGAATLDQLLGPGTYYLAVSGAGNDYFNPLLANSGTPGATGNFDLNLSVNDSPLAPTLGPQVLTTDPAPSAVLSSSPLAIRIDMSSSLDPSTLLPGQTVQLLYSPDDSFATDGTQVALASVNFSPAAPDSSDGPVQHYEGLNELQLFPQSPLAPGYYEVYLAGNSSGGAAVIADLSGNNLNASASNPDGQDFAYEFQVDGIDGNTSPDASSDDTPATAHNLGNVTSAGLVQVAGAIGDDPFYGPADSPGNQVDMYHFTVSGPGNYALVAEIFAGRIGSPLQPGLSLYKLDPDNGSLDFIAGDINSYDPAVATDGFSTPLYSDSILYASLTAGNYYIAVAGGPNTPSPLEGQPVGSPGLFDPTVSHSGQNGWSTGPYVLNLLVQPATTAPRVVSTSLSSGANLTAPPTLLSVTFSEPVNIAQLAYQSYQVAAQTSIASVFIDGPDGTIDYPRFESYDSTTNQATFLLLSPLPNGDYQLHLSGSAGLTDLGGNELVGNTPSGDYVLHFTVNAPTRGTNGDPLDYSDQEPNDDIQNPQTIGVIFPDELASGVTITRDFSQNPTQAPHDTQDVYEFQTLLDGYYSFTLSGNNLPSDATLTLTDSAGQSVPILSEGGTLLLGDVSPGTYLLIVNGWTPSQAPGVSYQISLDLVSSNDNAPPLVSGPAPAVAIRLTSAVAASTPTSSSSPTPPPTVTPPPLASDPSSPVASPTPAAQAPIDVPAQTPDGSESFSASFLGVNVLATSSVGGVTGPDGSLAAPAEFEQAGGPASVATALIAISAAFPISGHAENLGTPLPGTQTIEPETESVEVTRATTSSQGLPDTLSWIAAAIRDLLPQLDVQQPFTSNASILPRLASLDSFVATLSDPRASVAGVSEPGLPNSPVAGVSVVAGVYDPGSSVAGAADTGLPNSTVAGVNDTGLPISSLSATSKRRHSNSHDWRKVYPFAVSAIGLATVWYTRRRELSRRVPSRGQWSRWRSNAPTSKAKPAAPSSPVIGALFPSPSTSLPTVRRIAPPVAPQSAETSVGLRPYPQPLIGAGVTDE